MMCELGNSETLYQSYQLRRPQGTCNSRWKVPRLRTVAFANSKKVKSIFLSWGNSTVDGTPEFIPFQGGLHSSLRGILDEAS
ncbi:hypothetical protein AKJ16_DCAP03909 [Drosera capensis]